MAFYVEPRFTQDIDLLLRPSDFFKMKNSTFGVVSKIAAREIYRE